MFPPSLVLFSCSLFFVLIGAAPTEIYTLSLHDALPISRTRRSGSTGSTRPRTSGRGAAASRGRRSRSAAARWRAPARSEEHTSELQSHSDLVCRLLLEKKNNYAGDEIIGILVGIELAYC